MHIPKPIIGIHLDLKYQIPSKAYLNQWVQTLPEMGINTLLIEYEDKFPYQTYPFLQTQEAFTPAQLKSFLAVARQAGLQIIPLVQTLSHLEFALGHEQLAHLRETSDTPTQIDTSNPQAIDFVKTLLDEVLEFHRDDSLFHLGGDETWHMGHNERTAPILARNGLLEMWVQHTTQFVDHVKQAGKRAIVWDDIFWKVTPQEIKNCSLSRDVIFHCWNYGSGCNEKSVAGLSKRVTSYQDAGFTTIGAPCHNWGVATPRHQHCLDNNRGWAITSNALNMAGVISTAWSCFHIMPFATTVQVAAIGRQMQSPDKTADVQWQEQFMGRHFGCDVSGFVEAMKDSESFWEIDVNLERPMTAILYGCMDMILWFGSQKTRMKQGQYPVDFDAIDFADIFRQKLALLKDANADNAITKQLQAQQVLLARAATTFNTITSAATANVDEANYLAFVTELKQVHVELLIKLLGSETPEEQTMNHWLKLGEEFAGVMKPFMDEPSFMGLKRMWWEPVTSVLPVAPAGGVGRSASTSKDTSVG